jgi:hypothetical protein
MAVTTATDLQSIQQLGDAATDVAFAATPILAIPGLAIDVRGRISDAGGDSIDFSVWETDVSAITQTAVRNSRTGVTPSKLSLTSYNEPAKTKIISIDGDRYAISDSSEDALLHLAQVIGKEFAREVQSNLITQAVDATNGTDLVHTAANKLTVSDILAARLKWADHASEIGAPYLFLASSQFADLATDSDFKTMAAGGSATPVLPQGDWTRFVVAQVFGVNLVLCDSLPVSAGVSKTALMIGPGAFGIYVANSPETVMLDHAGSSVKTIDTHFRYASTMYRHNPRRVVKLVTSEA